MTKHIESMTIDLLISFLVLWIVVALVLLIYHCAPSCVLPSTEKSLIIAKLLSLFSEFFLRCTVY